MSNLKTVLDVRAFGAKGDGTTDDAVAIQAAINAAPEGSVVFIPAGTYLIGTTLLVDGRALTIEGAFSGSRNFSQAPTGSTLKLGASTTLLRITDSTGAVNRREGLTTIRNLGFFGNKTNFSGDAIFIDGCQYVRVEGCWIARFTGNGIKANVNGSKTVNVCWIDSNHIWLCDSSGINWTGADSWIINNEVAQCGIANVETGIVVGSNTNRVVGNHVYEAGSNGIFTNGSQNVLLSNRCDDNQAAGISLDTATGISIIANQCESNGRNSALSDAQRSGIRITGACVQVHVSGNITGNKTAVTDQKYGIQVSVAGTTGTLGSNTDSGSALGHYNLPVGTALLSHSGSDFVTDRNVVLKSGTSFLGTIDHAISSDRTWTLADASYIVSGSASALTSGRVPFATTGGLLMDDADMTFNGSQLALSVTGSSGGLLIGGDATLYRSSSGILTSTSRFESLRTNTTDAAFSSRIPADTNAEFAMLVSGEMRWGSGSATFDTVLSRTAANRLDLASGDTLRIATDGSTGALQFGASGDVVLYRSAANVLRMDTCSLQAFRAASGDAALAAIVSGDAASRYVVFASGSMEWGDGTGARDVLLGRGAADRLDLGTGDSFNIVSGNFQMGATTVFESDRDLAVNLTPNGDNSLTSGTSARRWSAVEGVLHNVRAAASDTNPTAQLVTTALKLGTNSADNLSVTLSAGAANRLDLATGDSLNLVSGNITLAGSGNAIDFSHSGGGLLEASDTTTGLKILSASTKKLGFYGATPIVRPAAYTQTYSTADKTLGAYTSDPESSAYTGIDNAQGGTVYATVADLNALRTAYETLRVFTEDAVAMLNAVVDDQQALGLVG